MEFKFDYEKLVELEFLTRILRNCPAPMVTFEAASTINKANKLLLAAAREHEAERTLIEERFEEAQDKEVALLEKKAAIKEIAKRKYTIELSQLSKSLFKDIDGEGKYISSYGQQTYSYREAFFGLLDTVISE